MIGTAIGETASRKSKRPSGSSMANSSRGEVFVTPTTTGRSLATDRAARRLDTDATAVASLSGKLGWKALVETPPQPIDARRSRGRMLRMDMMGLNR